MSKSKIIRDDIREARRNTKYKYQAHTALCDKLSHHEAMIRHHKAAAHIYYELAQSDVNERGGAQAPTPSSTKMSLLTPSPTQRLPSTPSWKPTPPWRRSRKLSAPRTNYATGTTTPSPQGEPASSSTSRSMHDALAGFLSLKGETYGSDPEDHQRQRRHRPLRGRVPEGETVHITAKFDVSTAAVAVVRT